MSWPGSMSLTYKRPISKLIKTHPRRRISEKVDREWRGRNNVGAEGKLVVVTGGMLTQVRHGVTETLAHVTAVIVRSKILRGSIQLFVYNISIAYLLMYWKIFGTC